MAATTLRGYDPTTLAWKESSAPVPENSFASTDVVNEGLLTVVALRKRRQQSKATKGSATNKAAFVNIPLEKKTFRIAVHEDYKSAFTALALRSDDFDRAVLDGVVG
ncbi:hypothetical protein MRX96_008560 [Rhipicephalus microplus]